MNKTDANIREKLGLNDDLDYAMFLEALDAFKEGNIKKGNRLLMELRENAMVKVFNEAFDPNASTART